jgi:hypothetical protein
MHSADQKLIILSLLYATNLKKITFANASAEGRAMGMEQTID